MITCKHCNSNNIKALVHVQMYIDANKYMYRLSKKAISGKSTELWETDWNKTSFVCKDCGYTFGYNYENQNKIDK